MIKRCIYLFSVTGLMVQVAANQRLEERRSQSFDRPFPSAPLLPLHRFFFFFHNRCLQRPLGLLPASFLPLLSLQSLKWLVQSSSGLSRETSFPRGTRRPLSSQFALEKCFSLSECKRNRLEFSENPRLSCSLLQASRWWSQKKKSSSHSVINWSLLFSPSPSQVAASLERQERGEDGFLSEQLLGECAVSQFWFNLKSVFDK